MVSSSKLQRLLWEMQFSGLKEKEEPSPLSDLEAYPGFTWDTTVAQSSCKPGSNGTVLLRSGIWSMGGLGETIGGLVLRGWTIRT